MAIRNGAGTVFLSGADKFSADPDTQRYLRMQDFEHYMAQHPGAAPGGTGDTGLLPNDAAGWSKLMERQQQYLQDASGGKMAAPRFGGYDLGSFGGGPRLNPEGVLDSGPGPNGDRGTGAARMQPALSGLKTAIGGGGTSDPITALMQRATEGRTVEGGLQRLRDNGLLPAWDPQLAADQLAAQKFQLNRSTMSPVDLAQEALEANIRTQPGQAALDRDDAFRGIMNNAEGNADAFWLYGQPVQTQQNQMAMDLAMAKGQAATLDDQVRSDAAHYAALLRYLAQNNATAAGSNNAALTALGHVINGGQAYGKPDDTKRLVDQFIDRFNATGGGGMPGPGAVPGAAPGATPTGSAGTISEAELQRGMVANGWTREQALAQARQRNLTVVP